MNKSPIAYIELPCQEVSEAKQFYGFLFGWTFEDWGPDYASFNSGTGGGLNGAEHHSKAPLVILETDDLEAMADKVAAAGGTITLPIFSYPGGRRFHFTDPSGHELAVMQSD